MHSIGIDIGHSTLKCTVLDDKKKLLAESCIFHQGNTSESLKAELRTIREKFAIKDCNLGFVGEHSQVCEKYRINGISALIEGTIYKDKTVRSVIEIGSQSSRYIMGITKESKSAIKFSTNSSCSAGTGSFLEEQVSRLGIELNTYASCIQKATKIPRIAGRCSVFSKTDMIHHQQAGVEIADILLGLAYALVRNYKANVVQRNKVEQPVMFIGGVAYNKGVVRALKDVFNLEDDDLIIPQNPSNVGALGAALLARDNKKSGRLEDILAKINKTEIATINEKSIHYEPLGNYGLGDSKNKHIGKVVAGTIEGYIGVDIGSTSTNLVLIDREKNLLSFRYIRTRGNPRKATKIGLESILEEFKDKLTIKGIGTTGSERMLLGKELDARLVVNEITAQAKGAVALCPDVDTIFEIGGQDSKYIQIKNGNVVDFEMNKICAAGTGSFIEEQAKKLGIAIEEYETIALKGETPLNLGNRCTVFIEGNISKAISVGESKENITAGLSYSIVCNYLDRVVVNKPIGNKILFQGGLAHNQAVINAFRSILNKEIIVPPFFSVLGAYGVALLVEEEIASEKKEKVQCSSNITSSITSSQKALPFYPPSYSKGYIGELEAAKLTVGIPRVLFMHRLFPLFNVFFNQLGFNVILSEETNKETIALSQIYATDETCYPVKLVTGHVAALIDKGIDYLFLPSMYAMKNPVSKTKESYACVYIQALPKIITQVMPLESKGIKLLSPAFSLNFGIMYTINTLLNLGQELGKNKIETALALKKGMQELKRYEKELKKLEQDAWSETRENEKIFVIITRAYGIADEGLNMEIPQKLRAMGHKVLTLSSLKVREFDLSGDYPNMCWSFGQHVLAGAKIVRSTKNLYAIYLTYHGCGPDTILSHYFEEEMQGKPYLHVEVDEHASTVGVITRLEAFVESLKNVKPYPELSKEKTIRAKNDYNRKTFIPSLFPYSQLFREMLRQKGIDAEVLPPTDKESLEIGKKFSTSKECLSLLALLGDVFQQINNTKNKNFTLWFPQSEEGETLGQYSQLLGQKIARAGYNDIIVESPFIEDLLADKKYGLEF